ncbi:uncharacterized protein LOC6580687 [Drosophila mojavensis]|uniref:Odorant-binding protein 56c n=1 Tax=Drosophila mojavensis TaxID=7230 RepID=B4KRK8_DROMO|nr:uncharacterized protein LOC6580687 [Drosophila mojavensis]EDW10434.2 Odorant-binding protein 56c [Drosophila mojavensis]
MHTRASLLFLAQCLCLCLNPVWARSVSVSLNMSLTRSVLDEQTVTRQQAKLSQDLLQSCMRETEISMSQLKFFRLSLLFNDNNNSDNELAIAPVDGEAELNAVNNAPEMDYVSGSPYLDMKRNEPLQCFVRCLYESLGIMHYDMMLEEAFKMQLDNLMQRLKPELKECKNMKSRNRCEAAYKLHLCYNHLKNLDTEQRLREMLERTETNSDLPDTEENETDNDNETQNENESDNENIVSATDKANEIIDAMQRISDAAEAAAAAAEA